LSDFFGSGGEVLVVRVAVTVVGRRRLWVGTERTSSVAFIMFGLDYDSPEISMTDLNEMTGKTGFKFACF
jgi:hypothetical protein